MNLVDDDADRGIVLCQNRVISCFKKMVEELPREKLDVKEFELITRYIQPCIQPLFDDVDNKVYLRFTNTQTDEHREDVVNNSDRRPDAYLSKTIDGRKVSLGFCEVKTTKYKTSTYIALVYFRRTQSTPIV